MEPLPEHARPFLLSLILGCAILISSFALAADKQYEYTKKDNNKDVTLELYDITSLLLPVRLGTGYSWKVASLPDILEQEGVTFKNGGIPGAPEIQIFRFRSTKKGNGKLVLVNVRPWEKPEQPQETFTLNITVE